MKIKFFLTAVCLFAITALSINAKDAEVKIKANMHCASCVGKIQDGLKSEAGVSTSNADLKSKIVTIAYDDSKTNPAKLKKAIAGMGFDATDVKAECTDKNAKSCDTKEGKCCSTKDKKAKVKKS
jgi:mercuric ion binding protein